MSSSKNPPSCLEGSLGTPWGLHQITEIIGEGEPIGMVFEGRMPIGQKYWECSIEKRKKNLITTRIFKTGRIGTWTQSRRYSRYLRSLCLHSRNES